MPSYFIYVYAPSDFASVPPTEDGAGGTASGSGPWTLTLLATANPVVVEITDDDNIFDELDTSQVFAQDTTIGSTTYSSGDPIFTAYDLINSSSGLQVSSLHMGYGDGYRVGAIDGIASTSKLVPGTTYTFDQNLTSHNRPNQYINFAACFVKGTRIATPAGPRLIETLAPGDLILRPDGSAVPLRLLAQRHVGRAEQERAAGLRPVRISAGALGDGLPERTLKVSRQHRMVVTDSNGSSVLAAAIRLCDLPGIRVVENCSPVDYFHLIFDTHEVVIADGCASESFLITPTSLHGVTPETRRQLCEIYPDFVTGHREQTPALPIPERKEQKAIVKQFSQIKLHTKIDTAAPLSYAG